MFLRRAHPNAHEPNVELLANDLLVVQYVLSTPPKKGAAAARTPQVAIGRYHVKTVALKDIERDLIRALVQNPRLLSPRQEFILRWALSVSRLTLVRTPTGQDIDLLEPLGPYRQWLAEHLRTALPADGKPDGARLRLLLPSVKLRMDAARQLVLNRHVNDLSAEDLDQELRFKKLVLVLGGGGGAGFAHLGVFELMEELGLQPHLLVGASMGSLMGLFRSLERPYSSAAALQAVPEAFDLARIFRPFNGSSRFGMPGAFHMQLIRVAREALENLVGRARLPVFEELPIRLEVVATGVRSGFASNPIVQESMQGKGPSQINAFSMRRWLRRSLRLSQDLAANPRMLKQIVFGSEDDTRTFSAVEAVGFSCSVPGIFCYDVFHDDPHTVGVLEELFERHGIWRMTDGGVVNNVPSRVAWESVMRGNIGTRNAYIFASDVFAPTPSPLNLPYTPVQQIARQNVRANRPFSDYTKTFRSPPSPINLSPSYSQLRRIIERARKELVSSVSHIRKATAPLPPYGSWSR